MIYHHVYKLWLLKTLNDYGNFKEAAHHARMTQSAVSQNLSALEKAFKKVLVIRERGGIRLTPEGLDLLKQVRPVLDILHEIDETGSNQEALKGTVRIGAYESIAVQLFHYLYDTLEINQPDLKIEVISGRSISLLDKLRNGHIDMAFTINAKEENKLKVENIAKENFGLYASPDNSFLEAWEKDKSRILKMATIAPTVQDGYPLYYKRFLQSLPFDHKVSLQSDSFETLRSVAEETSLVAVLPHRVAKRARRPMQCLWPQNPGEQNHGEHFISFVWRDNIDEKLVQLFSNVAKKVF